MISHQQLINSKKRDRLVASRRRDELRTLLRAAAARGSLLWKKGLLDADFSDDERRAALQATDDDMFGDGDEAEQDEEDYCMV